MREYEYKKSNIYVSDKLYILEKVDKDNHIYYPGDDIIFTVLCINNSDAALDNILIRDILPSAVVPVNEKFIVEASKGEITQKGNIIEVKIEKLLSKEAVRITIIGKVSA